MTRSKVDKPYRGFNRGLITEVAGGLAFPENSCYDLDNVVIGQDGVVQRRLALERESATTSDPAVNYFSTAYAFNNFKWSNPSGLNGTTFVVSQFGRYVNFFVEDSVYNDGKKSFSIDLADSAYKVADATTANVEQTDIDAVAGKGKLIITGKYIEPLLVSYDSTSDTIVVSRITLEERDFEGIEDGLDVDERPATLSAQHDYNLQNQGWTEDHITDFNTAQTPDYPSNSDIEFLGYDAGRTWDSDNLITYPTNTPAPKGHFVRQVFDPSQSSNFDSVTVSNDSFSKVGNVFTITTDGNHGFTAGNDVVIEGTRYVYNANGSGATRINGTYTIIATPTLDTYTVSIPNKPNITSITSAGRSTSEGDVTGFVPETFRCSVTAFFAGRAWYAGMESVRLSDRIYFSQVIDFNDDQYGKCYQVADPTAENDSDLVATDGGSIKIPGVGAVRKLLPVGQSLVVFSSTGVWAIGPGEQGIFTATSFSVRQISAVNCSSKAGVLLAEGTPIFWSESGIYRLVEDKVTGFLTAQDLSTVTIKTFFLSLTAAAVGSVKGVYDNGLKRAVWMYKNASGVYKNFLTFAFLNEGFYKWSLSTPANVVPVSLDSVGSFVPDANKLKVLYKSGTTAVYYWAEFKNRSFLDFTTEDYESFIATFDDTLGDLQKNKQATYLYSYFRKTETLYTGSGATDFDYPSGCTVVSQWDWHKTGEGGRWSASQQAYRFLVPLPTPGVGVPIDIGASVVYTRLKIRGKGKALALRYTSVTGKDFQLLGYSIPYTAAED